MPPVEYQVAALIVAPDKAIRSEQRCPSPQCKVTDDYVCKDYNVAACMGRLGNRLSHLLLALSKCSWAAPSGTFATSRCRPLRTTHMS